MRPLGGTLLTVAHMGQRPENCERENLKALCVVCHLRHDRKFRGKQRQLKREWFGQLNWLAADEPLKGCSCRCCPMWSRTV